MENIYCVPFSWWISHSDNKTITRDKVKTQAGTELGKAQPKLRFGNIVAKLYNLCQ